MSDMPTDEITARHPAAHVVAPPTSPPPPAHIGPFSATFPADADLPYDTVSYGPDIATERVFRLLGNLEGKRVLELGCGSGQAAVAMAAQGAKVIAVDPSPERIEQCRTAAEREEVRVELHQSDLAEAMSAKSGNGTERHSAIGDYLRQGQKLLVQATRDPLGDKGARLSSSLSLSSRCLVFLPGSARLGISQRIDAAAERARLLSCLREALALEGLGESGGYILRTAAEGSDLATLRAELRYLQRLWARVRRCSQESTAPGLLYADLPLHLRIVRDRAASTLERVLVDHPPSLQELRDFCGEYLPELCERLQAYRGERPLFESFGAEVAVREALERRVELDCGGFLVIDQTESMTTIDVNTGSFVGGADPVETVLQTNLEAATMVARQLRLRNLGGIIVIDFIDMSGREQRRQLESALRESLQRDPSPTTFSGMSDLGLAIVSRKLTGKNLLQTLGEECPRCLGRGAIKSARTICYDIAREVNRVARTGEKVELLVQAAPAVVALLRGEEAPCLAQVCAATAARVRLQPEPLYGQEHFDIAML